MNSTTYRLQENELGMLEPVSAWKLPEFQRFAAITLCSALLMSLVAAFNLKADVDIVTKHCAPYIQHRVSAL